MTVGKQTSAKHIIICLLIMAMMFIGTWLVFLAFAKRADAYGADRPCTETDVARFERMFPRGSYHVDPQMQMTLHYLGTSIRNGTCYVAIRPGP